MPSRRPCGASPGSTSALGWRFCVQMSAPLVQVAVPAAHTPCLPLLQAWPVPGLPSST